MNYEAWIVYNRKKKRYEIKGFVLSVKKAKNEDTITTVLTSKDVRTYYRFYGARHSILRLGNLIDFEVEGEDGRFLPRLCSLSHIGFSWQLDRNRVLIWHNFLQCFELHLRDTEEVDRFYFDLLLEASRKWERQNPKRIVIESYLQLLTFEGRLYPKEHCYICEGRIEKQIALMQAFRPAHPHCIYAPALPAKKIADLLESRKTTFLEDHEVEHLFEVVMRGF